MPASFTRESMRLITHAQTPQASPGRGVPLSGEVTPVDSPADPFALLSASEAAIYARVSVAAIGNWAGRGYCLPDGTRAVLPVAADPEGREIRDGHGRPKYRLVDVARAEHATHKRARREAA